MKKEWILWNALQNPENITADERMEQIEWQNYYWSYKALIQILFLFIIFWPSITALSEAYLGRDINIDLILKLIILQIIVVIESGRFLYSCYFGNQEFYDRSRGKTSYLLIGFQIAVISFIMLWAGFGFRHPFPWVISAAGIIFYWGLCHLSYLHYALLMDEATEEIGLKSKAWIPGTCGVLLTVYFIVLNIFTFSAITERVTMSYLTEEEQAMIEAIEQGIDSYYALENYRKDYRLEIDAQPEAPLYDESYNYDMAHSYCLSNGEELYNQIRSPGSEESIYREYHRESADPFSWEMAYEGRWISENDWSELWAEHHQEEPEFWYSEPYAGIPDINPKAITSITKEEQDQNTCYTITYNQDYNTNGATLKDQDALKGFTATDRYILNEYNTLIQYEHMETGVTKATEEPQTLKRTITILSVNKQEIQAEMETLKNQYQHR